MDNEIINNLINSKTEYIKNLLIMQINEDNN